MIQGWIDAQRQPYVSLQVVGLPQAVDVILDTGFSGALCLAQEHLHTLQRTPVGEEWYELGDGRVVPRQVFLVDAVWFGVRKTVRVIATQSRDSMMGSQLLDGCVVTLDYAARRLTIAPPGMP